MYHQRKYWTVNRDLFQEVIDIVFSQMFQKRCRIASWDNYLIHDKWKNSKNQHLSHSFVSDASLNLIKKGLWFILCYILKFNNKLIFDYQNIHLPYGSIWKNIAMDIIKLLEDSDPLWHQNWMRGSKERYRIFLSSLLKVLIKERLQVTQ